MSWYSFFKYSLVRPFVKLAYKAKAVGTENIPSSGFVCSSLWSIDSVCRWM